jgi:hypothetical protein
MLSLDTPSTENLKNKQQSHKSMGRAGESGPALPHSFVAGRNSSSRIRRAPRILFFEQRQGIVSVQKVDGNLPQARAEVAGD